MRTTGDDGVGSNIRPASIERQQGDADRRPIQPQADLCIKSRNACVCNGLGGVAGELSAAAAKGHDSTAVHTFTSLREKPAMCRSEH
jgi:hypothetical protein